MKVRLVISTIAELYHILPLIAEYRQEGRDINVLYGIPLPASQVSRLAAVGRELGEGLSVMVDHASQLEHLEKLRKEGKFSVGVYLKVDTGYHRAGLPPAGLNKDDLLFKLMELDKRSDIEFIGLYSHSSLSYNDSSPAKAMANLEAEIAGCFDAIEKHARIFKSHDSKVWTISVGASPQVTSVEGLLAPEGSMSKEGQSLRAAIQRVSQQKHQRMNIELELHAGVYSLLDVQQLATKSRAKLGEYEDEIAISVITEVCSVYNNGERNHPEALASVGVLGLGREPCAAYKGWGILDRSAYSTEARPQRRLIVSRVSQEHSILAWEEAAAGETPPIPLRVGQSIRIFPNHACITGAMYGWYLVVDSGAGDGDKIIDVWCRASGW